MKWHVMVIDDRMEFALHVWRYLSRSLCIGSSSEESSNESWISRKKPLCSADGVICLWWVHAGSEWKSDAARVLDRVGKSEGLYALIDIMGDRKSDYVPIHVHTFLREWASVHGVTSAWRFVSAYQMGGRFEGREVFSKSRTTLNEIRTALYGAPQESAQLLGQSRHVLITGAGFEIRSRRDGFGMPPTRDLLRGVEYLKSDEESAEELRRFPVPKEGIWKMGPHERAIKKQARDENLDLYWDVLLEGELWKFLEDLGDSDLEERRRAKAEALLNERKLRESFRRSILNHDWGHMNQSLMAAQGGWHAWLTTNYTQFSNRAISLVGNDSNFPWRIVSTASEANTVIREDNWNVEQHRHRYLFKLHGDIGHLQTMAIAGHDKDSFSPLCIPVDSLYQIYAAAERFLGYSLLPSHEPIVWHIVGHGLRDKRLLKLLERVVQHIRVPHLFLVVDPFLVNDTDSGRSEGPHQQIKDHFAAENIVLDVESVVPRKLYAEEYMARILLTGLPPVNNLEACREWFKGLPSGVEE